MNSYERFDAILEGKKPDKMPFYFPTIACSVASEILGREVDSGGDSIHFKEEASWLDGENAHQEFVERYRENAIELYRKLGADIARETWRSKGRPTKKLDDYTLLFGKEDGPHVIKRFFPENQSYGVVENTTGFRDIDELKQNLLNEMKRDYKVTEDVLYEEYKDQLELKKMSDPYFPSIVGGLSFPFSMGNVLGLEALVLEPELLRDYYLFHAEIGIQHIEWLHKQGYKFINGGADMATNTGPIFSPKTFETIFVPSLKRITEECSKYGMIYCYRTDGDIWAISDAMFLDGGVQAFGEVDRLASMTVGSLRERYPDLIILGNNSSSTLAIGAVEEVREETRASLEESGGLNFIPGPSNAIVHGTPVENVYAMVEEINNYKP